jgi:pilus assembly protein CpaC
VADAIAAARAESIAGTLGKVVDLLRVTVPKQEPQILLKVRFATVSRSATSQLGFNFFSANGKGVANTTTGQFGQYPSFQTSGSSPSSVSFSDLLNIFYYRPDLNIGAFIQALEAKSLAQVLAEPNLLTVSGRPASFLAGGEFPFPTIQGGAAGVGQVTIQFKEFGIRLNFLPTITPRGTIRLLVTPEVSSLDYANGLTVNGYTVPGLATRRVQTELELMNRQSFAIAGLLDRTTTEQISKVPGLANIPVLGKLFTSRSLSKNDDELIVLVTPELVGPLPVGAKAPDLNMPLPFVEGAPNQAPSQPGPEVTGPLPALPNVETLPIEQLRNLEQENTASASAPSNPPAVSNAPAASNVGSSPVGSGLTGSPASGANK